jgi:hypothetical protein
MSTDATIELATLRFDGARFAGHALDVECTQELIAYRNLVLECAKSLWRARYPNRVNLPKGFGKGFRLQFNRVEEGSALVPLQRVRVPGDQGELELNDEFDEAVMLIDQTIAAANNDDLLPSGLPANVIPMFRDFGRTLRDDEVLFTRARGAGGEAAYTARARKLLAEWVEPTYEDVVDVAGEVRMANVGPGRFALQVDAGGGLSLVEGKFNTADEVKVLDALHEHRTARLRVRGVGEFGTADRMLKRFARVDEIKFVVSEVPAYDETAVPIWEQLDAIGRSAPAGAWDAVPTDLSVRIDEVVYGSGEGRA